METALPIGTRGRVLALALTAVVGVVAWVAVVSPLIEWHGARHETIGQRRALLGRMEGIAARLPEFRRAAAETPAPRAVLEGASDPIAGAALQLMVEALAAREGLTPTSTEALPAQAAGAYRRLGLRLVLNGGWPALVRLLEAIDQASPRMLVDDLQLQVSPSVTAGGGAPVGASFTVLAFRAGGPG